MKKINLFLFFSVALLPFIWAEEPLNLDKNKIAIHGYDPVAYFTDKTPTPGLTGIEAEYEGAIYRFANAKNRSLFVSDPESYIPEYGGYCAWAVGNGVIADVDPKIWTVADGRLFLNNNSSIGKKFVKKLESNIKKADARWPELKSSL